MWASSEEALSFVFFLPVGGNETGGLLFSQKIFWKKVGEFE